MPIGKAKKGAGVDDLATLSHLDQDVLLDALKGRFEQDVIYTYVGDILVAVNPFKELPIYTEVVQRKYKDVQDKSSLAPHVYALSDVSYHTMLRTASHQCCVISGESGAGKTESAKYMIRHIIYLCHAGARGESLEKQILQVNPLLEAFGNAATTMNDNSSRFGKYTELMFHKTGEVCGARISDYLLEKSRVVFQLDGEQNFHIFYYLFQSPKKDEYGLTAVADFPYMRDEELFTDREAATFYSEVLTALSDVGFDENETEQLHRVLAAVLHCSRLTFSSPDPHDPSTLDASAKATLEKVCTLLGIDADLFAASLISTTSITRGEAITKPYTVAQAMDSRDAMAKELYRRMFAWIVSSINTLLNPEHVKQEQEKKRGRGRRNTSDSDANETLIIGILDIFGFENFSVNSFEQFCINLANEQLQHFFNDHIFKLEMAEYKRQGVDVADIAFQDNQPVLDLFLGKPIGLLALLDEESHFPRATDESLVTKFKQNFSDTQLFSVPEGFTHTFHIKHYAGQVLYRADGFLYKNRDSLSPDIVSLFVESTVSVVAEAFSASVTSTGQIVPARARWGGNVGKRRTRKETLTNTTNKRAVTVGGQFRNSLALLVANMQRCLPHFIRCIKPNTKKASSKFMDDFVVAQLNYTGMLETTRIRKEGFSVRPSFEDFMERYKIIAYSPDSTIEAGKHSCQVVLDTAGVRDYKLGRTKVFLRYYDAENLQQKVNAFQQHAVTLQRLVRGYQSRKLLGTMRKEKALTQQAVSALLSGCCDGAESWQQNLIRLGVLEEANRERLERERQEAAARAERERKEAEQRAKEEHERKMRLEREERKERERREEEERAREERKRQIAEMERREAVARAEALDRERRELAELARREEEMKQLAEDALHKKSVVWWITHERPKGECQQGGGELFPWFFGDVSRRFCEELLTDEPIGCFILRLSQTRLGYTLTFRVDTRCKHFTIESSGGSYFVVGHQGQFQTIQQLIEHFCQFPINEEGDVLTIPCPQPYPERPTNRELWVDLPGVSQKAIVKKKGRKDKEEKKKKKHKKQHKKQQIPY